MGTDDILNPRALVVGPMGEGPSGQHPTVTAVVFRSTWPSLHLVVRRLVGGIPHQPTPVSLVSVLVIPQVCVETDDIHDNHRAEKHESQKPADCECTKSANSPEQQRGDRGNSDNSTPEGDIASR